MPITNKNTELTSIITLITSTSSITTVPKFFTTLLSSKYPPHQPVKADLKKDDSIISILELLFKQDAEFIMTEWIMKKAQSICSQEIVAALDIGNGLHFNASKASAEDLMAFSMDNISQRFERATPCTCALVQNILDLKKEAQQWVKPTKSTVGYDARHKAQEDMLDILGEAIEVSDSDSNSNS